MATITQISGNTFQISHNNCQHQGYIVWTSPTSCSFTFDVLPVDFKIKTFKIKKNYYDEKSIYGIRNNYCNSDCDVSEYLSISLEQYQNKLLSMGGYFEKDGEIYFESKKKAAKVLEWIESVLLINKLGE